MKSLLALAILLLVSVPSGASAESWNLVQSEPFRVVGDVGHQDLALAARTLEQFRRSVLGLFPERRASSSRSLTVIVIGGRGIGRCYAGGADNVGGFYRRGTYEDFIVMRSGSVGGPSLQTVLHEYQHAITSSSE